MVERLSREPPLGCLHGAAVRPLVKIFFDCTWKTVGQKGIRFLVDGAEAVLVVKPISVKPVERSGATPKIKVILQNEAPPFWHFLP